MKKKWYIMIMAAFVAAVLSGCGKTGGENISAGMEMITALEYDGALASFQTAREAKENERLILRGEGLAYMGKTMYEEASQSFEQALALSNGKVSELDYDINYYLATVYYKLGEKDKAAGVYDAITALKSDAKDAYYLRGVIRTEQGNLDAAREDFDRTIALNSKDYDRLIEIYSVLASNGFREVGQEYLQASMDAGTKDMTNYEKGRICYYLEDYENARTYLEKARDESGYEAVLFLGKTYEILGDNNYAISVYNSYLDSGEENPQVYNQLGLCKMNMRDYQGALNAFQAAMKVEENGMMQTLKMNEIIAYEYLGEYRQAEVLMGSYLKTYPDDQMAQREHTFLKTR